MTGRIGMVLLVAGCVVAGTVNMSFAAEKKAAAKEKTEAPKEQGQLVTQSEYAQWLVQSLGLSRFLPPNPTDNECFAILLQNGISPMAGWQGGEKLTRADLKRTVSQALGVSEEDLEKEGVDIGSVGAAVESLSPIPDPEAVEAVNPSGDPLNKVHKFRPIDEQQNGVDMATISHIFVTAQAQPQPAPVTPN